MNPGLKMSQFALNMRIVKIVSKLSLQGLKTVLNLVSNCLKIWDNFETSKGYRNLLTIADYRVSLPLWISATKYRVAIVFVPAPVIEMQNLYD